MPETIEWSPHPLHRPGLLLVGLLHLAVGVWFVLDARWVGLLPRSPVLGPLVAFLVTIGVALTLFLPGGDRRSPTRLAIVLLVTVLGLALHLGSASKDGPAVPPGYPFGGVLLVSGLLVVLRAEWRRRQVRVTLSANELSVFVRPYRLEHALPLDAVRDVSAARTAWGRLWGYGDFLARVRKGTMQDRITKPLVGEAAPPEATRGNGWDEEERFHLVAAFPYKRVRRELENRILLAKMPPKDREEAMLAERLAGDLGDVQL